MGFAWAKKLAVSFGIAADDRTPFEQDRDRLFKAARDGDAKTAEEITTAYPDEFMNWRAKAGSPLKVAQDANQLDIFKILVRHGSSVNESYVGGITPLMCAVRDQQKDFFEYLLDAGATLDTTAIVKIVSGEFGRHTYTGTALHLAIKNGDKGMALKLLERGADPRVSADMRGGGGTKSAGDYAAHKKQFAVADLIKRHDKIRAEYLAANPPPEPPAAASAPDDAEKIAVLPQLQLKKSAAQQP